MPTTIDTEEFKKRIQDAKDAFNPEIHGRFDLPQMPDFPLDHWFERNRQKEDLIEQLRLDGVCSDVAQQHMFVMEQLMQVLNPAEKKPYIDAYSYIYGKNPQTGKNYSDHWNKDEVGSVFLWYSYSPETCRKAAEAIKSSRIVDLIRTAHDRNFIPWPSGDPCYSNDDFWRLIKSDLVAGVGIQSLHKFENTYIKMFTHCASENKMLLHELIEA